MKAIEKNTFSAPSKTENIYTVTGEKNAYYGHIVCINHEFTFFDLSVFMAEINTFILTKATSFDIISKDFLLWQCLC